MMQRKNTVGSTPSRPHPALSRRDVRPAGALAGFTLVELLIVIGILGLLVSILMPSLSRARALARAAVCKTRMRSQTQAHAVYGGDNAGLKPPLLTVTDTGQRFDWVSPDVRWLGHPVGQGILVAGDYLELEAILCPASSMTDDAARDRDAWGNLENAGSSYVYFWRHPSGVTDQVSQGGTYDDEANEGRTALVMDINCQSGHKYRGEYEGRAWQSHPMMEQINVAYVDSSVHAHHNGELVLRYPAGAFEELLWFEQADSLR